jgi:predicted RNA methylase
MSVYDEVYLALAQMREAFHRYGRIDDSNAKLDEVSKLFAAYVAYTRDRVESFPLPESPEIIEDLEQSFRRAAMLPEYMTNEGISIFGANPKLVLRSGDELLAKELVSVVRKAVDVAFSSANDDISLDILNEAFGHFIRDNFRSNIEDAQYMTPPEVVDFIAKLALSEWKSDHSDETQPKTLTIMDPSCGVGSFLTASYNYIRADPTLADVQTLVVGQDKVERMVRLTAINMALFNVGEHDVTIGNSLVEGSPIDKYNGSVDLILTNPPFGARFPHEEVKQSFASNTPFFSSLVRSSAKMDSELLFVDRALRLLKPGGRLFVVVPDGVVSAKGIAAVLRHYLQNNADVKAIIELPSVTFAQAGTRTRTSIVYLQKRNFTPAPSPAITFAIIDDLGFKVSSRKGVQVKQDKGENQLPAALLSIQQRRADYEEATVLSNFPSVTCIPASALQPEAWAASQYSAGRLKALSSLTNAADFDILPFHTIANLSSAERRAVKPSSSTPYLSVLHVIGDGIVDINAIRTYHPKTPGLPLIPGELVFSRLNPHITRVAVIPNIAEGLLCSSEFEIITAKEGMDVYEIAYLMNSPIFLQQVIDFCSGTSSSHSRIRSEQLSQILVATPRRDSPLRANFDAAVERYRCACQQLASSLIEMADAREEEAFLMHGQTKNHQGA